MKFPWYLGGLALLATTSCSNPKFEGRPELTTVQNVELPAPGALEGTVGARPASLGPGDKISINVFAVPELSREVTVDSTGTIALPLVGSLDVMGLTPAQLSESIRSRLVNRYVREPDVSVNIVEVASQNFAIEGEVRQPGVYPMVGDLTLMRALATGGGTTEYARSNLVIVYRRVDNKQMAALYDVRAIRLGAYSDPRIYPGDLVVVNEDRAYRQFGTIIQGSGILLTPLVAVLNNL